MPYLVTEKQKKNLKRQNCNLAEMPANVVKCLHEDYISRKKSNSKNALNYDINLTSDLEIISFKKSFIKNFISNSKKEFLVFRFLCDLTNGYYGKSNATPIIMPKGSFQITDSSGRAGRNGNRMGTKERIANWELKIGRMKRVNTLIDYHYEAFGIGHEIEKIDCFIESDRENKKFFNLLFIRDTDLLKETNCGIIKNQSKKRKTNIVFYLSHDSKKPDFLDSIWSNSESLKNYYDNGSECCPI